LLTGNLLSAGEKELIDCGQLGLEIFNALKDEFKVNIFTVLLTLCKFAELMLFVVLLPYQLLSELSMLTITS